MFSYVVYGIGSLLYDPLSYLALGASYMPLYYIWNLGASYIPLCHIWNGVPLIFPCVIYGMGWFLYTPVSYMEWGCSYMPLCHIWNGESLI